MASQPKITGFYRPTKANSSAAASKRRKAIIEDPVSDIESIREIKPVIVADAKETIAKFVAEPPVLLKSDQLKVEPVQTGNTINIFTELGKTVQKKPSLRKSKKTVKSSESSLKICFSKALLVDKLCAKKEIIQEETTSFADNHDYNPIEVSTPKGANGSTTSCRKRKMQCVEEQSEIIKKTPEKPVEKSEDVELSTKVRKKLDMGSEKVATNQLADVVKANIVNSPSKPVSFLCMGPLSPRKPGINSPIRTTNSPLSKSRTLQSSSEKLMQNLAEKRFKSPAVKSLASLLDKVPSPAAKV